MRAPARPPHERTNPEPARGRRARGALPLQGLAGNRAVSRLVVARRPKPKPRPWFSEVLDAVEAEEKSRVRLHSSYFGGWALPYLRSLEALARAVDAGDAAAVRKRVPELLAHDPPSLYPYLSSEGFANELVSRMLVLGVDREAQTLRRFFREREVRGAIREYGADMRLWELTVDRALAQAKPAKGQVKAALAVLCRTFRQLFTEAANLDEAALKADRASMSYDAFTPSHRSISAYEGTLVEQLRKVYAAIQRGYQALLDDAIEELQKGKGKTDALDEARKALEELIAPLVFAKVNDKSPENVLVDVTRSEFKKGGGAYLDAFLEGRAARQRSIKFEYYDTHQESGFEKQLTFGRVLWKRREQLKLLERLYGVGKTGGAENAAIIGKLGGLKLNSDDDWRRFLDAKLDAVRARTKNDGEALTEVIELLKGYLGAFTIHTPFNLEEFGDNYLSRTFPRALTGQLIHDCGVYALRIAYALSLVRKKLGLRFRFIRLPVHVGLLITGKDLPLFVAHNNAIDKVSAAELDDWRKRWRERDTTGALRDKPVKLDEDAFLADVAAAHFLPFADLPYRFEEAPEGDRKADLFDFYHRKILPDVLKPGKGEVEQFHLQYLGALEEYKRIYNDSARKFWNVDARPIWERHRRALGDALKGDRKTVKTRYQAAAGAYRTSIEKAYAPVRAAMEGWHKRMGQTATMLAEHKELLAKGAKVAYTRRPPIGWQWEIAYEDHLAELADASKLDAGKLDRIAPPFEKPDSALPPVD